MFGSCTRKTSSCLCSWGVKKGILWRNAEKPCPKGTYKFSASCNCDPVWLLAGSLEERNSNSSESHGKGIMCFTSIQSSHLELSVKLGPFRCIIGPYQVEVHTPNGLWTDYNLQQQKTVWQKGWVEESIWRPVCLERFMSWPICPSERHNSSALFERMPSWCSEVSSNFQPDITIDDSLPKPTRLSTNQDKLPVAVVWLQRRCKEATKRCCLIFFSFLMDKGKIEAWLMTKFNWILNNHRLDYRGPIVHTLWEDKSICLMSSSVITVLLIHVSHFF
jgi:hypothetical protein